MGILELIQQKAFVGRELLTWMWFRAETRPTLELGRSKVVEIEVLDPIVLEAHFGDAKSTTLKGGSPATSPEATTAVMEGKKLRRARFKLSCDGVDWIATIDAETMAISGLNVPRAGRLPFDELLRFRCDFIMEFESMLTELWGTFLEIRLDPSEWNRELKKIHGWIEGR